MNVIGRKYKVMVVIVETLLCSIGNCTNGIVEYKYIPLRQDNDKDIRYDTTLERRVVRVALKGMMHWTVK